LKKVTILYDLLNETHLSLLITCFNRLLLVRLNKRENVECLSNTYTHKNEIKMLLVSPNDK